MIINLTQHVGTPEQGVTEPPNKLEVQDLLTFGDLPSAREIYARASALASIALNTGADSAMIGGAPYLMSALESALMDVGVQPLYAFSVRESIEQTDPDGSTRKVAVFRHKGWVCVR